jgi:curved DNA-binding protein CbpA
MGQTQSQIDPRHIGIYKKLLAIQNPQTRLQMIDTLLGDPSVVYSAKASGIYASLLQYTGAIRHNNQPPLLPGEAQPLQQSQQRTTAQHQIQNQLNPVQMQIVQTKHQQDHYQRLAKPKSKDKALSFFTACLKVLNIEEEVALTEETLKKAYKKAAIRVHPDKGGSKDAFDAVTRAYAYLQDILRLVKGRNGSEGAAVPGLDTVNKNRNQDSESWAMPKEPVVLNAKDLNLTAFNKLFEETRIPDPDEDGYGDWLKDSAETKEKRIKGKKFSEEFNRDVFNRMFEEEQQAYGRNDNQVIRFQHPQELTLATSGVELGRDRPPDYTAAPNADVQYTDLRQAYTKENTISEKVKGIRVEARDFNSYQAQRERAPDVYNQSELASLHAYEAQQNARESARRLRAAQEQVGAQDYFERMKQRVITMK